MPRHVVMGAALCALVAISSQAPAKRAEIRPGQYFGITATGCPEAHCDDFIGFPVERKDEILTMTGANLGGASVFWEKCEKSDPGDGPSQYDWSSLDDNDQASNRRFTLMIGIKVASEWADALRLTDKERWSRLVERFSEAAARECRRRWGDRAKFYHVPGNEPSLKDEKSLPEGYNWYTWYMEPAIHIYNGVKRASAKNQVVVGALVVGDEPRIGSLYLGGLKDHFDVLDIHAYAPGDHEVGHKMHVGIDQIIEAHGVMEKHGDGDKKIYLGEGWSLWPKPEHLYRKGPDEPVTPEMIEHYRQALLCGYRNLTTPRDGFDPEWVMGARYFILNDFWQKMHWKERAKPRYENGKLKGWVLDGYWIQYEEGALDPTYRDWGLIHFDGTPKAPELLTDFPPYIPKDGLTATIELPAGKTAATPGEPYRVTVTTTNGEKTAFTDLRFGLGMRKWWNDKKAPPAPKITPLLPEPPTTVAPGRAASGSFLVEFSEKHRGKRVRLVGDMCYTWQGKPYYADAWIWVNVE